MLHRFARWLHRRLCPHDNIGVDCTENEMSVRCCDCGWDGGQSSVRPTIGPDTDRAFAHATGDVRWEDERCPQKTPDPETAYRPLRGDRNVRP